MSVVFFQQTTFPGKKVKVIRVAMPQIESECCATGEIVPAVCKIMLKQGNQHLLLQRREDAISHIARSQQPLQYLTLFLGNVCICRASSISSTDKSRLMSSHTAYFKTLPIAHRR